jgi:hypothetical protein
MKHLHRSLPVVCLIACLAAGPVRAEDAPAAPQSDMDEGFSLLEEGAKLLFRGFLNEMGPALDEMQGGIEEAAREMGPALRQLLALVDDVRNYEAPERLPNGDVIIRRRADAPPPPELPQAPAAPTDKPAPEGEIEL